MRGVVAKRLRRDKARREQEAQQAQQARGEQARQQPQRQGLWVPEPRPRMWLPPRDGGYHGKPGPQATGRPKPPRGSAGVSRRTP